MGPGGGLGEIITFYSYKGGTGRTMALANLAYLLARDDPDRKVLAVDWDLEAPGLHRYFRELVRNRFPNDRKERQFDAHPGLIDLFLELNRLVCAAPDADTEGAAREIAARLPLDDYLIATDLNPISLLKAGGFGPDYQAAVNTFDWEDLHIRSPWLFRAFAELLASRFDYVLIDSRTGLTDIGGICTSILPDKLVVVFTPNRQSLIGSLDAARRAARYRKDSDDLRPLRILPLPSRIEAAEPGLRDQWRFGDLERDIPGYQAAYEMLFNAVYDLPGCDLESYFSEVQIQHVPRFAYGEEIAALVESGDRLSLTRSFE